MDTVRAMNEVHRMRVRQARSSPLASITALSAFCLVACGQMYPLVPDSERIRGQGANWTLEVQTEAPPGVAAKAQCALALLDQVRADPSFAQSLEGRCYNFENDSKDADATPAGVAQCAMRPISIPWRLRHCHWPGFLNREVGANRHDDGYFIRTYACWAEEATVGQLAAHLLHEHMHTCGYEDVGGDDGSGLATYVVGELVETLVGKVNDCPPRAVPLKTALEPARLRQVP